MSVGEHSINTQATTGLGLGQKRSTALLLALRLALLVIATALAASIAVGSRYGAHPDERYNIDAFEFFETHWWPPALDSDEVIYTPYGASRVHRGELVYGLFGKLGGIARSVVRPEGEDAYYRFTYWTYRLLNVALLAGTLAVLLFNRRWRNSSALLALAVVCIPQVLYLYGYANSDAWGLSLSFLLLALALSLTDKPIGDWSWSDVTLLGILTGLLLTAKLPFLVSIGLPYTLLGWHLFQHVRQRRLPPWHWMAQRTLLLCLLAAAIGAPLRVIYPMTQGDYKAAQERAREKLAHAGFKPSNPTASTVNLASKGETYQDLFVKHNWLQATLKSHYGVFGYFTVWAPQWVLQVAGVGALVLLLLTVASLGLDGSHIPLAIRAGILVAPLFILLNIAASLYNSLHVDCQPQGRYLFPSLAAVALLTMGPLPWERTPLRVLRLIVLALLLVLSVYTITQVLLPSDIFW